MPTDLPTALADIRAGLLDAGSLRRAVAAGRRRGTTPRWVRVELRPVRLKSGDHLQVVTDDGERPSTRNVAWGPPAEALVDELLAEPYANWHLETGTATVQLRVTRKGAAQVHRAPAERPAADTGHDRPPRHLLDPGDPLFDVIGGTAAKRRQVDAFLRALAGALDGDGPPGPLTVVDLGCGNAYLTFAAYRYLSGRGYDVTLVGVDRREQARDRNTAIAERLGWTGRVRFLAAAIGAADLPERVDVVLALHACDTATDDALARAVRAGARHILAAPCCHHDIATQLRAAPAPAPYAPLTRAAVLRERFADVLTDSLRAALLRLHGYRVEVLEFIDSAHTPRNLLLRARWTGAGPTPPQRDEYADLVTEWRVRPRLATLLGDPPEGSPPTA
jgi:SAM-dependent methyltransferase